MNTKLIMSASAITLGIAGIFMTFIPDEILTYLHIEKLQSFQLCIQILGALYFSLAMLNWMTKTSIIGGIYNRPIAVANFTHFLIGGLALIKGVISHPGLPPVIMAGAGIYSVFAISFGVILFRHPSRN
jgi:hypothetical protein